MHLTNGEYDNTGGHIITCVNASSGATLWSFDPETTIFEPTIHNDLLLFGASDGNFYVLSFANGSLIWKTHADTQDTMAGKNLSAGANYTGPPAVTNVLVDDQEQRVMWGFAVRKAETNNQYLAIVCSLDLSNGGIVWTSQIIGNGFLSIGDYINPTLDLVPTLNAVYLKTNNELWLLDKATGDIKQTQHFDYDIRSIAIEENLVFIIEDVNVFAYT
jgi:outer membrane protein assembly factor BamB